MQTVLTHPHSLRFPSADSSRSSHRYHHHLVVLVGPRRSLSTSLSLSSSSSRCVLGTCLHHQAGRTGGRPRDHHHQPPSLPLSLPLSVSLSLSPSLNPPIRPIFLVSDFGLFPISFLYAHQNRKRRRSNVSQSFAGHGPLGYKTTDDTPTFIYPVSRVVVTKLTESFEQKTTEKGKQNKTKRKR